MYNPTNLQLIAVSLYRTYVYPFFLAGIVLLVAMIGAIVLTLTKLHKNKRQDFYFQNNKDIFSSIKKLK
jgi:general stress protein CsbA